MYKYQLINKETFLFNIVISYFVNKGSGNLLLYIQIMYTVYKNINILYFLERIITNVFDVRERDLNLFKS